MSLCSVQVTWKFWYQGSPGAQVDFSSYKAHPCSPAVPGNPTWHLLTQALDTDTHWKQRLPLYKLHVWQTDTDMKQGNFRVGVILTYFVILLSSQKLCPLGPVLSPYLVPISFGLGTMRNLFSFHPCQVGPCKVQGLQLRTCLLTVSGPHPLWPRDDEISVQSPPLPSWSL